MKAFEWTGEKGCFKLRKAFVRLTPLIGKEKQRNLHGHQALSLGTVNKILCWGTYLTGVCSWFEWLLYKPEINLQIFSTPLLVGSLFYRLWFVFDSLLFPHRFLTSLILFIWHFKDQLFWLTFFDMVWDYNFWGKGGRN